MVLHTLVLALALLGARPAHANTIEGFTPSGNFQTVGVTEQGALDVSISSGVPFHVVVDSGNINAFQAGPWNINIAGVVPSGGSLPVEVANTAFTISVPTITVNIGTVTTSAPISTFTIYGVVSLASVTPTIIYPADPARKEGTICNISTSTIWIGGDTTVSNTTAPPLPPGACYSPDNPSSYTGVIYGYSNNPSAASYIYHE